MTNPEPRPAGRLLQVLGLWFGIAAIIGNSIGAGILRTPSDVATQLPSAVAFLAVWLAGGIYAGLGVASVSELAVMMPKSGGQYVYAKEVFGPYLGFVVGWTDWISTSASAAAISMMVAEYSSVFISTAPAVVRALAVAAVAIFTALLWRGIRSSDRTVQLTAMLKVVALVLVPVAAFAMGTRAPAAIVPTTSAGIGFAAVVVALQSVIYTYDGWNGIIYFSGEVKNPGRDIPRSMFAGVAAVTVLYALLVGCYLYVLGVGGIAADTFPAGQVAQTVFGEVGGTIIRVVVIVTGMSAIPPILMMASRVPWAMAGDGLFPRRATRVNPGGTPTVTLAITALLSVGFIITGTFSQVIAIAAFFFVFQYLMSFTAVFVLRRRQPDRPRPYRAIGYPVTTAISWLGSAAFLVGAVVQDRRNSLIAIGLLIASWPIYRLSGLGRDSRAA